MTEQYMEKAIEIAAQCWCDEKTKDSEIDAKLVKAVAKRIASYEAGLAELEKENNFLKTLVHKLENLKALSTVSESRIKAASPEEVIKMLRHMEKRLLVMGFLAPPSLLQAGYYISLAEGDMTKLFPVEAGGEQGGEHEKS